LGDILDEAYGIVQCKECPWYKSCVTPMRFTAEDMATAAQSSLLEGCPIFINRLRANPKLSQHLKELMQNWGKEEA